MPPCSFMSNTTLTRLILRAWATKDENPCRGLWFHDVERRGPASPRERTGHLHSRWCALMDRLHSLAFIPMHLTITCIFLSVQFSADTLVCARSIFTARLRLTGCAWRHRLSFCPFCVPLWQWTARTLALIGRLRFQSTSGGTKPTCGCLLCQRQHPITAVRGGLDLLLSPQLLFTGHPTNPNCSMSMSWLSSFLFALFWLMPRHRIMA